jgi:hypothetical protein
MRQPQKTTIKAYEKNQAELKLQKALESWRKMEYAMLGYTETFIGA